MRLYVDKITKPRNSIDINLGLLLARFLDLQITVKNRLVREDSGGLAHLLRLVLQGLNREPPDRARETDGAGNLAGEVAHAYGDATRLGIKLPVVEADSGAAHLPELDFIQHTRNSIVSVGACQSRSARALPQG